MGAGAGWVAGAGAGWMAGAGALICGAEGRYLQDSTKQKMMNSPLLGSCNHSKGPSRQHAQSVHVAAWQRMAIS